MVEWINPEYAQVMAAYRRLQVGHAEPDHKAVKVFLVPESK